MVDPFVSALIDLRARARARQDWETADLVRSRLVGAGIEVHDEAGTSSWDLPSPQAVRPGRAADATGAARPATAIRRERSGSPAQEQEHRVGPPVALHRRGRHGLDIGEPGLASPVASRSRARSRGDGCPRPPDRGTCRPRRPGRRARCALRDGAGRRSRPGRPACPRRGAGRAAIPRGRTAAARWRVGHQVEADGRDVRAVRGTELLRHDLEHARDGSARTSSPTSPASARPSSPVPAPMSIVRQPRSRWIADRMAAATCLRPGPALGVSQSRARSSKLLTGRASPARGSARAPSRGPRRRRPPARRAPR